MFKSLFLQASRSRLLFVGGAAITVAFSQQYVSRNNNNGNRYVAYCDAAAATATSTTVAVNKYIDHTVLKQTCVASDIEKLCDEAKQYNFAAVCVPPNFVKLAKELTKGTEVKVATVIGFPFGYSCVAAKKAEITQALKDGADELDIVANVSAIKSGNWDELRQEIKTLMPCRHCYPHQKVKVIIESGMLTDEEIIQCCETYGAAGIDFLKTSTGYAEGGKGASIHAVQLFRQHLPAAIQIKASGGIRDYASAKAMIDAGATRIGCSAGVSIVKGATAATTATTTTTTTTTGNSAY